MFLNKKSSFISGIICGLTFAPVFFILGIFMLSILCFQITNSTSRKQAFAYSYLFGFGFFLTTLYWISFGVSVYIEEFWWAIPIALFGLPAFLALFTALHGAITWEFKNSYFYHFIFCCVWIFVEWLSSWLFTGFPWGIIGYSFSISDISIQIASIFGIFGLSFIAVYIGSSLYSTNMLAPRIITSVLLCIALIAFGYHRLQKYPTEYSDIKVRVVQPSISKWSPKIFWENLDKHITLSKQNGNPDIILWSESALTAPHYYKYVHERLLSSFSNNKQILLTGGVGDNAILGDEYKIYSSLIAIDSMGNLLFDYHKSHLVPFGEYMPLSNYLPIKKITPGIVNYSSGVRKVLYLKELDLHINPLICYESIFAQEVRVDNTNVDVIINITNDSWYGNSSGPYQHFEISKIRAVENGLPMIRAANNGISAIIDPLGRIIGKIELDKVEILDGYMPLKLATSTFYSKWGNIALLICVLFVLIIEFIVVLLCLRYLNLQKNACCH